MATINEANRLIKRLKQTKPVFIDESNGKTLHKCPFCGSHYISKYTEVVQLTQFNHEYNCPFIEIERFDLIEENEEA